MTERLYVCMGGPFDGREILLSLSGRRITFPIAPEVSVKHFDSLEWEEDPLTGVPRIKREPFGQATYEVSGDVLLFITP